MVRVIFGMSLCVPALLMGCKASVDDSGDSADTHKPHSSLCVSGEHVTDNRCVPCPSGTVRPAGDDPQGDNTSCSPCEDGEAPNESGESCETCEDGFVSSGGADQCTACPSNTYEVDNACMECEPDFVSEEGSVSCELEAAAGYLDPRDYGYLFWPGNHWVNWGSFFNVQHVQTGF